MIGWVFFDVGNVLLDEDPLTFLSFRRHVEAVRRVEPGHTFLSLLAERSRRADLGSPWPVFEVVSTVLGEHQIDEVWRSTEREVLARFAELSPPIPGVKALVDRLARRFRLGLIANQGIEGRARLAELGLLDDFEVVAFSEELGLSKPDLGLFRLAIERAGAPPEECLMVGDRLDNDVVPAAALGMATAWVRWPDRAAKGWNPPDPEAIAYRDALEISSARAETLLMTVRPTLIIDEIGDLEAALAEIESPPHL